MRSGGRSAAFPPRYPQYQHARQAYAEMCRIEGWSTRVLRHKIDSMLYERTALSRKPEKLIREERDALRDKDELTPDHLARFSTSASNARCVLHAVVSSSEYRVMVRHTDDGACPPGTIQPARRRVRWGMIRWCGSHSHRHHPEVACRHPVHHRPRQAGPCLRVRS